MGWGQTKWRGAPARHSTPSFHLSSRPFPCSVTYLSQYITSYRGTFFTMSMWSGCVRVSTLQPMIQDTVADIMLESGTHILKEVSHLFPVVHRDKWVLSSPEMVFGPWRTLSLLIWLIQIWCNKFGEACFDNNIACSNNCCSKQDIILHKATKQASRDDFIPLAKETYSCLHPHFDSFLLLVYMLV